MRKFISILVVAFVIVIIVFITKTYFFHPKVYPFKSLLFSWAGDTKIIEFSSNTISEIELRRLRSLIRPGDIFLNRSNYYISNIGIPGFWTHASLYVGTPRERNEMFKDNSECTDWVKNQGEKSGSLDKLLQKDFDSIYEAHCGKNREMSIIESVSEGVILSDFSSGARKDGIVVLRPTISFLEIQKAIYIGFGYVTKPYDYNFDFSTDTVIACTELVYKAYKSSDLFPVNEMFGKPFSTANEIAEYCDKNYGEPKLKLSLIYIYDGEKGYTAGNDTAHAIFRKSWNESLW